MNFNIYIDRQTGERLDRLARKKRKSRNALIREALTQLVENGAQAQWPPEVAAFEGVAQMRPFEAGRSRLRAPRRDPFG